MMSGGSFVTVLGVSRKLRKIQESKEVAEIEKQHSSLRCISADKTSGPCHGQLNPSNGVDGIPLLPSSESMVPTHVHLQCQYRTS